MVSRSRCRTELTPISKRRICCGVDEYQTFGDTHIFLGPRPPLLWSWYLRAGVVRRRGHALLLRSSLVADLLESVAMRIRSIKPEFWNHPVMGRLPDSLQLLALGLLNYADDEGYFLGDPKLINAALRALRPHRSLPRMLSSLQNVQWIEQRYHAEMGHLCKVRAFSAHQRIDRPKPSTLNRYWNEAKPIEDSTIDRRSIAAGRAGKGRAGQGTDATNGRSRGQARGGRVAKKPEGAQQELPEIVPPTPPKPPRAKSEQEELYETFQADRKDHIEYVLELPFEPDKPATPMHINTAFKPIIEACGSVQQVKYLFEDWWESPFAAKQEPPFTFFTFSAVAVWRRLIEDKKKLDAEYREAKAAE